MRKLVRNVGVGVAMAAALYLVVATIVFCYETLPTAVAILAHLVLLGVVGGVTVTLTDRLLA